MKRQLAFVLIASSESALSRRWIQAAALHEVWPNERIDIPVEYRCYIPYLNTGAMVLRQRIWLQHVGTNLRTPLVRTAVAT
jgi:hypothetical protein